MRERFEVQRAAGVIEDDATSFKNLGAEEARLIKKFEQELKGKIYRYTDDELKQMKQIVINKVLPNEAKKWKSPNGAELLKEVSKRLN